MASSKPIIILAPGGAFNPAHYGYLLHLFLKAGYGALSAYLPSTGTLHAAEVSIEDDATYIRERLVLPVLENEGHDVIVVGHSYSSLPVASAVIGLDKKSRGTAGKKTSVIGQIYIAGVLAKGGDGHSLTAAFGGAAPSHMMYDESANLVRCADPIPPLLADVERVLAHAASISTVCPSLSAFQTPIPLASWADESYKNRIAYVKTTQDAAVPPQVQDMLIQGSGAEWKIRKIATGHAPFLVKPEELAEIIIQLAKEFESA